MKNKERIISAAFITLVIVGLCKWCYDDVNKVETPDVAVTKVTTTNVTTETTTGVTTSCTTSCTTTLNTTVETTEISTEPTTELVTEAPVTDIPTAEVIIEEPKNEPVIEVPVAEEPVPVEEYLVYKPSSYYIHKNTCRWNKDDAYRVDDVTGLEARLCTECNPQCEGYTEYIPPEPVKPDKESMTYVGNFKATYYPATAYYDGVCGGSERTLLGYGDYGDNIRGSIASRSLWSSYGYNRNGRTTVYLEFPSYPEMSGLFYVDDCSAWYGIVDVFVWSSSACPFGNAGVTSVDCYIE